MYIYIQNVHLHWKAWSQIATLPENIQLDCTFSDLADWPQDEFLLPSFKPINAALHVLFVWSIDSLAHRWPVMGKSWDRINLARVYLSLGQFSSDWSMWGPTHSFSLYEWCWQYPARISTFWSWSCLFCGLRLSKLGNTTGPRDEQWGCCNQSLCTHMYICVAPMHRHRRRNPQVSGTFFLWNSCRVTEMNQMAWKNKSSGK